jgi:2'-5' RNA ligase
MPPRVFVAIELSEAQRGLVESALRAFITADRGWAREKIVRPALLHITLTYLGAWPDNAMAKLIREMSAEAVRHDPFTLQLTHLNPIPSLRRANMVWTGVTGDVNQAAALTDALTQTTGLQLEAHPFRPHVTLARARFPRAVDARALAIADELLTGHGQTVDTTLSVRSVTVFSSTLASTGPVYERLAVIPLKGVGELDT